MWCGASKAAAHYFPDTPTWREIAQNMQQCAKMDEYQKWRDGVWKELSAYYIPHGPGFAYFRDKKIKLHLFMNESLDWKAVQQVADAYKRELSEYSKMVMPPLDSGTALSFTVTNRPPPEGHQLYFFYRPPDGDQVKVPADFMPPFPHRDLPTELKSLIVNSKPRDPDTLLKMVWQYKQQQQAQQRQGMTADTTGGLGSVLRQAGVPDSVARMAGLPVAGPVGGEFIFKRRSAARISRCSGFASCNVLD